MRKEGSVLEQEKAEEQEKRKWVSRDEVASKAELKQ